MIIKAVKISLQTKIKIYDKHGITIEDIKRTLLDDWPWFVKTRLGRYTVLGKWEKYLTIVFEFNSKHKEAEIITAYPSSDWQIKLYKKKK